MIKKIIFLILTALNIYACCTCTPSSCTNVVSNLKISESLIKDYYFMYNGIIGNAFLKKIAENEFMPNNSDTLVSYQNTITDLARQIVILQRETAVEEKKRNFLLKKIKLMKIYKIKDK